MVARLARKSAVLNKKTVATYNSVRREAQRLLKGFQKPSDDAYKAARDVLNRVVSLSGADNVSAKDSLLFIVSIALGGRSLPGYSTLDYNHIQGIHFVLDKIKKYQQDGSQKRPLNFLMLASPGAGKSHFIRCIAGKLGTQNIGAVTYNMVGLQRHEDLIPALDVARNFKVEDRLPLLFLDEFDVNQEQFALLLPLLWDGQLTLGQHDLKLGKVVIVLAGSDPRLPGTMEHASSMKVETQLVNTHPPKLVDLLSRINGGVLRIPPLSDPGHSAERRADKICIAVQLLRQRFGASLRSVPVALLNFIASTEFRYGVRSIAHLIDLIPYVKNTAHLSLAALHLPLDDSRRLKSSSLVYHLLNEDQAHGIVKAWKDSRGIRTRVMVYSQALEFFSPRFEFDQSRIEWGLDRLWWEVQGSNRQG